MGKVFGTDGIRGKANSHPITPELALRLGKALAKLFREDNGAGKPSPQGEEVLLKAAPVPAGRVGAGRRHKVVIGKDTRLSGYMLETALTSGLVSMGSDVLLVGPMPTPAIAHLTKSLNADAGIVLSASHNPAEDNGIKIFGADGYKLPDKAEARIEALLDDDIESAHVQGRSIGKAYRVDDAKGRYIEFLKASIGSGSLAGIKIVLDCANGAAYSIAPKVFEELGAEVVVLNNKPDGLNINLNCGALHPEKMQEAVRKEKAGIGVALDGDADRVIVSDEKGANVDGDHIMAICALDMKKRGALGNSTVVATVMSNAGFEKAMKDAGITVVRAKVGDRYVIGEMRARNHNFGGEQSGHIIFGDYATTGDGLLTALQLLRLMKRSGKKLSELAGCMESFPQVLVNVKVKEKKPVEKMRNVQEKITSGEKMLGSSGRILVRYSGTENLARVMVEGRDAKEIEKIANEIAKEISKEVGE